MLSVSALDFINYKNALKGNYRKGIHTFRCILENPTQASNFATNLGGVCVVLGVPIGQDDRNSAELLALLQASDVIDTATLTWMSQWYEDYCDDWDTLAADEARCAEIAGNDLMWRAAGSGSTSVAKVIATLAGLSCRDYDDMTALAASSTAMTAVTASPVAVAAMWESSTALAVLESNATAWATFTGASSEVMGKAVAIIVDLDPADYADMSAVAASSTAMAAVIASSVALNAVVSSSTAMAAVAASSTAMAAVATSPTARDAVYNSSTAKTAMDSSPLKATVKAAYSAQSNDKTVNLNSRAFILKTTGSGSGAWTFFDLYTPPTATSTTSKSMGSGNAFILYLVGTTITTQHSGGSASDYLTIQYIPC